MIEAPQPSHVTRPPSGRGRPRTAEARRAN